MVWKKRSSRAPVVDEAGRMPETPPGAVGIGGALGRLVRRVLPRGKERERFAVSAEAAEDAQLRGDFAAAYELWKRVWAEWPTRVEGIRGLVECALERDHSDRAAEVVESALKAFPNVPRIIAAAARLAQRQSDLPRCIELWQRIVHRRDAPEVWHVMYGQALLVSGRYDELQAHLDVWQPRLPKASGLLAVRAMLEGARENWDEAVAVWRDFRRRFPNDPVGWEHYGRALHELEFARMESGARGGELNVLDMPVSIEVIDDEAARSLLLGFESIGSDCEFGLVQRRYGAEPLSLLRFNSVDLGGLIAAVAHRFDDMGGNETTELVKQSNGEFLMRDRRWGLVMHTFLFEGQVEPDVLSEKFRKRVTFLRDRFLADAADGRKVLVFYSPRLEPADLSILRSALGTLGPVTLLHVHPTTGTETDAPVGSAVEVEPDLFVGTISTSGRAPSGAWEIAYADWISVCRSVRTQLDAREPGVEP